MMKYFIITIDTEGDNLWDYRLGDAIETKNARYIPRFQELCDQYGYKPVYLTNYEMAQDDFFVEFASAILREQRCEIGMHLHAWNNPPHYELNNPYHDYGLPYLIEYPEQIMREKIDVLYHLLKNTFKTEIVSHRSGRWAMDQRYFDILGEYDVKIDCSITPHVSWKSSKGFSKGNAGNDYSGKPEEPYLVNNIREIPVTIRRLRGFSLVHPLSVRSFLASIKKAVMGKAIWLRPNGHNLADMLTLIDVIQKSESNYLMFMLHSSELMPGGNPSFRTKDGIELLYHDLSILFKAISKNFTGITFKNYLDIL
jgi:hypothetical protein